MTHAFPLKLEDILQQPVDDISQISAQVSFTLEDVINQKTLAANDKIFNNLVNDENLFLDEEYDDQSSSLGKQIKSAKNTVTQSNSKNKSNHEMTTSNTVNQEQNAKRVKTQQVKEEVDSLLHNRLNTINQILSQKKVGLPSAVASLGNKLLVIGTTLSNVIVFDIGEQQPVLFKPESCSYGAISSISIAKDQTCIACGCQSGFVFLLDRQSNKIFKIIPPQVLNVSITKVLFLGDSHHQLIKNDSQGNIFIHNIQILMWQVGITTRRLLPYVSKVVYYDIKSIIINNKEILCLGSNDFVLCLLFSQGIQPQIAGKIHRPKDLKFKDKIPNIQLGTMNVTGQDKTGIFISWGKTIQLYSYNPLERNQKFIYYKDISFDALIDFQIYSFYQMTKNLLVLIDSRDCFKLVDIHDEPPFTFSDKQIQGGIFSQKLPISGNRFLKSFSNTVCKATETQKDIYYISGIYIMRARLLKSSQYIKYLMQSCDWQRLRRQSISIYQNKIKAFADKSASQNKQIFQTVIMKYIQEKNKSAVSNTDLIPQVIEYCLETKLFKLLFKKIYSIFQKQGFSEIFIRSLEPFILQGMIEQLPNQELLEELMMQWIDNKPQLLQKLLVQLNKSSIDYLSTIELCRKYNLYVGLLYISEIHDDFITPVNRLIELSQKNSIQQNKQQLIQLIYTFINKTSNCLTITGNKTLSQKSVKSGLPTLVFWLLIQENMEWLIDHNSELYFSEVQRLLRMNIVKYYLQNQFPDVNVVDGLFRNCQILLQRLRSSDVEARLSRCLLNVSDVWPLSSEQSHYMLRHYEDTKTMQKFVKHIDINYNNLVSDKKQWNQTYNKLPEEAKAMIFLKQNNEQKAIELYFEHRTIWNNSILFDHLLDFQLVENLQKLLFIDCKLSAKCIFNLEYADIPQYTRSVKDQFRRYQLMRYIFKLDINKQVPWKIDEFIFYLRSLCRFRNQKRVLFQLKKMKNQCQFYQEYSIEALKIVKSNNLLQCEAFLLPPIQAFSLYQRLYQTFFQINFQKLLKFENYSSKELKTTFYNMIKAVQLCPQSNISGDLWFQLISNVLAPLKKTHKRSTIGQQIQKIYKMKGSQDYEFLKSLLQIIQEALLIVSSHTTIEQMTAWMQLNLKVLQLKFVTNCFCSTLKTYNQHVQTIKLSNSVLSSDILQNFKNAMLNKIEGIPVGFDCMICKKSLNQDQSLAFKCGHSYHLSCCSEINLKQCKVCIEQQLTPSQETTHIHAPIQKHNHPSRKMTQNLTQQALSQYEGGPNKMVYTLASFDDIVKEEEDDLQKFRDVYQTYLILY